MLNWASISGILHHSDRKVTPHQQAGVVQIVINPGKYRLPVHSSQQHAVGIISYIMYGILVYVVKYIYTAFEENLV